MSDNQQQNHNQGNAGDNIPEGRPMKFKYKPPSVYFLLFMLAQREIDTVEDFFDRAKEVWRKGQQDLEQMAARFKEENVPDGDRWGDEDAQLKEFAWLYSEFAIIGLWRCIELYEGRAKRHIRRHEQSAMRSALDIIKDEEKKIRCAESVNELRLLNNAIKHERQVGEDLAKISIWKNKKSDKLGDLESHYYRLRPFAKQYLEDLTERLINAKIPSPSPAGQVSQA